MNYFSVLFIVIKYLLLYFQYYILNLNYTNLFHTPNLFNNNNVSYVFSTYTCIAL